MEEHFLNSHLSHCLLCPRRCGANRMQGQQGRCKETAQVRAGLAWLHQWEEPCLTGEKGSGAVFFSGCSLGCIFCQNAAISLPGQENTEEPSGKIMEQTAGIDVPIPRLAEIFLELQEKGAANINLVTACHFVPQIVLALQRAKEQGLRIPVVYNSSGYEMVDTLRLLEGLVDIWLPDFKWMDPSLAGQYANAPDYPEVAKAALEEMVRQNENGTGTKTWAVGEDGKLQRGVIVRVLLLPGHVNDAKMILSYLHEAYGNRIYISILNQYTPMPRLREDPLLGRKTTRREYQRLTDYAVSIGITQGYLQEGKTAEESFVPHFDGTGIM